MTTKKKIRPQSTKHKGKADKKAAAGGKAEAAGGGYETLVAAWYCTRMLAGGGGQLPFDLPANVRVNAIGCQTDAPVDDINADTSDGGVIFVQAKRTLHLSQRADSALASALDQLVRQFKGSAEQKSAKKWARPLDPDRDRLVLAARGASSSKITEVLPRLLRGVRDRSDVELLSDVKTSLSEAEVARVVEAHINRSWKAAYGSFPTREDVGRLLRLTWVHSLDIEAEGRDVLPALDSLRQTVLAKPQDAPKAFASLVKLCARLRAERSGGDTQTILSHLAAENFSLVARPDYRADVAALRKWTGDRLSRADDFTRLLKSNPATVIEREVWPTFRSTALSQSFVVVGEPGGGKSGLTYRLAEALHADGADVVFLPVDRLNADSLGSLRTELGIVHDVADVLANWPGTASGVLIIDALDAARKSEAQAILHEVVSQVLKQKSSRWRVVASVRKYDLRQGTDWSRLFRGTPPSPAFADNEFPLVAHVAVGRLTDPEIAQLAQSFAPLHQLYEGAAPELKDLLRNIFNLRLLAQLLDDGVVTAELQAIRTQPQLLGTYWHHRIRGKDGKHDFREIALTAVVKRMMATKALRVDRADVRGGVDTNALVDLEKQDILRGDDVAGSPNHDVLLFTHHVIFDYAVARLVFRQGRDADSLVKMLAADHGLSLMLGPSLRLAFVELWNLGGKRELFWKLVFAVEAAANIPEVARLVAPMVVAELATGADDLDPVLQALAQGGAKQ